MPALALDFEPDAPTLRLLGSEHQNGTWVGKELLPIANRIRNQGGGEEDYYLWVLPSMLWQSYVHSTSDSVSVHRKHLESAWDKSEESKPFELDDALTDLLDRIGSGCWEGRAGRRNQAVASAFVEFCRDHNCFTRTMSRYELAKHTPGFSPDVVGKGLAALVQLGLLIKEDRTDRRSSGRSASRYRIDLNWRPPVQSGAAAGRLEDSHLQKSLGIKKSRSTSKYSLTCLCQTGDTAYEVDLSDHDLWSRQGLGQTALRVWSVLPDHPGYEVLALDDPTSYYEDETVEKVGKSADELAVDSEMHRRTVTEQLTKLFNNCMAVKLPGKPSRWLRAAYPPVEPLADATGCTGAVAERIDRIEQRQHANRIAYPSSYARTDGTEIQQPVSPPQTDPQPDPQERLRVLWAEYEPINQLAESN